MDISEATVRDYQELRLKEQAAPKTINEEVGFLLRILGDQGDGIRAKLRRQKALKLAVRSQIGRAFSGDEKARLLSRSFQATSHRLPNLQHLPSRLPNDYG